MACSAPSTILSSSPTSFSPKSFNPSSQSLTIPKTFNDLRRPFQSRPSRAISLHNSYSRRSFVVKALTPYSFIEKEASHVEGFSPELVVTVGGGKELEEKCVASQPQRTCSPLEFFQRILPKLKITSPPKVNFLLNGKGIKGRVSVSLDTGPQLPTLVNTMLKHGTDILQAIGDFSGSEMETDDPTPSYMLQQAWAKTLQVPWAEFSPLHECRDASIASSVHHQQIKDDIRTRG